MSAFQARPAYAVAKYSGLMSMSNKARPKIIVLGSMCRLPVAGVVFQILHYMLGLERLGFEAYYVEWHGNWIEDPVTPSSDPAAPRMVIGNVMQAYGFQERWICRADQVAPGFTYGGMSHEQLLKLYKEAEAIFNVTGAHFIEDEQLHCPRRVYIESDPGIPQIRLENGDPKMWSLVNRHTHHFTFGLNINGADCLLPAQHLSYRKTRQPIVLSLWDNDIDLTCKTFTTIARWKKHKEKTIDFKGDCYRWNKDSEFESFLDLPKRSNQSLQLALSQISDEEKKRLEEHGWMVVDALSISSFENPYRSYIFGSCGEFTIAKDQYVRLNTGWFSDRSACYLAAARPVITQDTGFGHDLPSGKGLFAFRTIEDILVAFDAINSNYRSQCEAAREIAHEYFGSDKVLIDILESIDLDYQREKD